MVLGDMMVLGGMMELHDILVLVLSDILVLVYMELDLGNVLHLRIEHQRDILHIRQRSR